MGPSASARGDSGEMVVLVRDFGTMWVSRMAEVIHATGGAVGLVTAADPAAARLEQVVDRVAVVPDPTDVAAVAQAAGRLSAGHRLAAVLSTTDGCVAVAAQVAELVGLRRTPAAPIVTARNKYAARELMRAAGLPVPGYALLRGAGDAAAVAAEVGLPAVVKPLSGTGSHLVCRVSTVDELAAAYRRAAAELPEGELGHLYRRGLDCGAAGPVDPARTVLVERALAGREFCVDLVVRDGEVERLPLVDKFLLDERFFELGFVSPPYDLAPGRERQIEAAAEQAVRALGLANTVAHVEVIDDELLGPTIVEVNAGRPGGRGPTMLNTIATGVDPTEDFVAVHRDAPSPRTGGRAAVPLASLNVFAHGAGRVRAVHGLAELAAHPDVVTAVATVGPGDVITDQHEDSVAGVVLAGFIDRDDLVRTSRELIDMVRVELDPR